MDRGRDGRLDFFLKWIVRGRGVEGWEGVISGMLFGGERSRSKVVCGLLWLVGINV